MNTPVGVAVLGYGYWGPNLVRNFAADPGAAVRWVVDLDPQRCEAAAASYPQVRVGDDPSAAFADPAVDLVVVATPISTHYALGKAALEAGKHVLLEKPMTADVGQARELVALAEARGLQLFVDHTYLFTPEVAYLKQLLESGELGELLYMDTVRINLGLVQTDNDVVWDLAPHDLSIVLYLIGRLPESVIVTGAAHNSSGVADLAMIHLDFGAGLVANVHVNWLSPVKIRHTILAGTKKMVVYDDLDQAEKVHVYDRGIEFSDDPEAKRRLLVDYRRGDVYSPYIGRREALALEAQEIVACLRGEARPTSSGARGLEVVELLSALSESLRRRGERVVVSG